MDQSALHKLSYGLFILTAHDGNKDNGCIINTAIQAASEPQLLSICVNKANLTHDMIQKSGQFTVSVLSQNATFELFRHFGFQSGRNTDKFDGYSDCERGANGIYHITKGTNAYFSVNVEKTQDLGSHTMFIGPVTEMEVLNNTPSATYEYYFKFIKPQPQAVGTTKDGQTIWRCTICGYEYVGEELPPDFICPVCKHPASDFEIIQTTEEKQMAKYVTKGVVPVIGSIYVEQYIGEMEKFAPAVEQAIRSTGGVMVFDIVHLGKHGLWGDLETAMKNAGQI